MRRHAATCQGLTAVTGARGYARKTSGRQALGPATAVAMDAPAVALYDKLGSREEVLHFDISLDGGR